MEKKNIIIYKFWAIWCAPCRMYTPVFKQVAEELKDLAEFKEINAEQDEDMIDFFGVKNLPTTIIYDKEDKKVIARKVGAMKPDDLKKWIQDNIK